MPGLGTLSTGFRAQLGLSTALPALGTLGRMKNNLRALRLARGWTQEEAASAMGTTRNQYVKLERGAAKGGRKLSDVWIDRAARAFGIDAGEIVSTARNVVPVAGYVGAGAEITDEGDPLGEIEVQWPLKEPMVAFVVVGDSMLPRYDPGWAVICYREGRTPEQVIGEEAVIRLADGRRFLKRLIRAGDRFHLESTNARLIENVVPEWIGEIHVVVPPRQFRKLNRITPS